ncbi:MAG: DUF839 domain-containing protein [Candidatus Hydrogenedentes bacterium]|nr:DUF839 domain-containing protein [Candidatus Hydrogenedentota bacterium]
MDDGFYVPSHPDGMGAFSWGKNRVLVVRNHELSPVAGILPPFGANYELLGQYNSGLFYDPRINNRPCPGCTTAFVYNLRRREVEQQYLGIAGTLRNCAGAVTPWGTWISCEETEQRADATFAKNHGYCFEVDPAVRFRTSAPLPLLGLGRFSHECVAVAPNGIVYETEDNGLGLIYRFVPDTPGNLLGGGRLQALRIVDLPAATTNNWTTPATIRVGKKMRADWVDLENVEAPVTPLRDQGYAKGAARFTRGEGMAFGRNALYFVCTDGGPARRGQLWRYVPSPYEGTPYEWRSPAQLVLAMEPNDPNVFDNIDNIAIAPWGHKFLCEDGAGDQFIRGIGPGQRVYPFAHNALSTSEITGPAFSPGGSTLFVNFQREGLTFAITGPWTEQTL